MKRADKPLQVEVDRGVLVIRIGINTLKDSAETGPAFWERYPEDVGDGPWSSVNDANQLAHDVARELQREKEDGTTPLDLLLDKALRDAYDDGSIAFDPL